MPEVLYRRTTARARKPGGPIHRPDTVESLKALYVAGQISMLEYEQRLEKVLASEFGLA